MAKRFKKIILQDTKQIPPFNERARELRILNKPLWLHHRELLNPNMISEMEIPPDVENRMLENLDGPCLVYRDNLYFDEFFLNEFLKEAQKRKGPSRAAFMPTDPSFSQHALPLSTSYTPAGGLYLADLWYYPDGYKKNASPLIIDLQATEIGYYHVPTYMAYEQGDLTYQVPKRALIAIDSWVHVHVADIIFGLYSRGVRFEEKVNNDLGFKTGLLLRSMYEGKQLLTSSTAVQIGENCSIDPSAVITGPTTIGNNVTIGAGAVIDNCIIGNNVTVSQGSQMMLSVLGDGAFFPFRASLFMTTAMENAMVAQNTCLQMCVVGKNSFLGAGTTFTDFNLLPYPIRAMSGNMELEEANRPVLGGCVGHNCRIGAGFVISPSRMIESDVVLVASHEYWQVSENVPFEKSHHHNLRGSELHRQLYPRNRDYDRETW